MELGKIINKSTIEFDLIGITEDKKRLIVKVSKGGYAPVFELDIGESNVRRVVDAWNEDVPVLKRIEKGWLIVDIIKPRRKNANQKQRRR